ncbi:MAG: HPr family phosphocarrier protein [Corynebacterium sp.]|uniref:HPr family phosphocarrier protein n=1 Tax=Corynebacterium sp. TaxID=1720 RepID=UPI0026FF3878|nr:HPr family phosphocarrier protein [Corynebacterium sp.]
MASSIVTVGTAVGLHARPATIIADAAGRFPDEVSLTLVGEDTESADASSALMIMALGAQRGDRIRVESSSQDAVAAIAELIASDLDASKG